MTDVAVVQLWAWQPMHIASSGLRSKRVGLVHGKAFVWRVFYETGSRWRVVRTRVVSVDDHRSAGNDRLVAVPRSRTAALGAADEDAQNLAAMDPAGEEFERVSS
jgi:hypothetical protein